VNGIQWSKSEDRVLRKAYPAYRRGEIGRADLCALFPVRTLETIKRRASIMGICGVAQGSVDAAALARIRARGIDV